MQCADKVILIRPTGFGYDPETAHSNAFQQRLTDPDILRKAGEEFDDLIAVLGHCGIGVTVLDPIDKTAPNAVFPNNWFSTHEDGNLLLYPMCSESRRKERDPKIARALLREGLASKEVLDFSPWEKSGLFLEGTGSMVLDRKKHIAYAAISPRTHEAALDAWCEKMRYIPIAFNATMDGTLTGDPVYHTNVVMSIGETFAVLCAEAMPYPGERNELQDELQLAGKELILITLEQMHKFVGNLLHLRALPRVGNSPLASSFILLSETAFDSLIPDQRIILQKHGQLVPVPVPTIEAVGGGSIRCMLAENFLPSVR